MINIKISKRDGAGQTNAGDVTPTTNNYGFISDTGDTIMAYDTGSAQKEILPWDKKTYIFKFVSET